MVLDIVTNHMGQLFYYDINLNGQPDDNIGGAAARTARTEPCSQTAVIARHRVRSRLRSARRPGVHLARQRRAARRSSSSTIRRSTASPPQPGQSSAPRAAYHGVGRILNYDDGTSALLGDFPGGLKDVAPSSPTCAAAMIDVYARWVELPTSTASASTR